MKKTPISCWEIFSLFVFGSIEFFLVAKHFPTTFGGKNAWRLLYDFPPNYFTWPCMEKHQFFFCLLGNENEKKINGKAFGNY